MYSLDTECKSDTRHTNGTHDRDRARMLDDKGQISGKCSQAAKRQSTALHRRPQSTSHTAHTTYKQKHSAVTGHTGA
eukprot:scaffold14060_cov133-Isochrysis_galbana.AAC.2